MKFLGLLGCLLFALHSVPVAGDELQPASANLPELYDPADAGRLLLVGFEDLSINRPGLTTSVSKYRRRGTYRSSTWSERVSDNIAEDFHLKKLAEWPMTEIGIHCVVYRIPAAASPSTTLQHLSADKRIKVVQKMNQFKTEASTINDPYFLLQSNLRSMQIDEVHSKTTGRDVSIGMIDTGVDVDHPDLAGQVSKEENYVQEVSPGFAGDKHGTAVAGIMVAKKNNGTGIIGVAPNARLVALKACWPDRQESMTSICNSYTLSLAVNNAIKAGVKVLNMSLSGPHDPLLELLLSKAQKQGIAIVAADNGSSSGDHDNFPAAMAGVIAVQSAGSGNDKGRKETKTILAPGERILTTLPHSNYDFISGSSMAAAQVSGIVALMLELKPDLTPDEIRKVLSDTDQKERIKTLSGINAYQAVSALCKTLGCFGETLSYLGQSVRVN